MHGAFFIEAHLPARGYLGVRIPPSRGKWCTTDEPPGPRARLQFQVHRPSAAFGHNANEVPGQRASYSRGSMYSISPDGSAQARPKYILKITGKRIGALTLTRCSRLKASSKKRKRAPRNSQLGDVSLLYNGDCSPPGYPS